ncbi:MAG: hypothetical protein JNK46_11205 [Methylobacteriaceae bacterium]|nr:hypothetical protein [Methylobacteriaceae bacterium]
MYDKTDPRAALAASAAPSAPPPAFFAPPEYGRFYEGPPQIDDASGRSWFLRGQNFVLAYSETKAGALFARDAQPDEYALLIPDATDVRIEAGDESKTARGPAIVFVPPGVSRVSLPAGGRLVRLFTSASADMVAACPNAASYATQRAAIPPFKAWPTPPDGFRIRAYSLDVAPQPGRFGRIFRCTTFMINVLDPQIGPRDVTKLSPHHHDDFEQCSLALEGAFMHHLRWPWTVNMNAWREDEHQHFASPSALVIPPPCIHTTRGLEPGLNQLIDIFSPPRMDFSKQPGWVLNGADYPAPAEG